jgi:hypothetical protein
MDLSNINMPSVLEEVGGLCDRYEAALVSNDVDALSDFFWDSPGAIRYGVTEELYGSESIQNFRKNRILNYSSREPIKRTLMSFGSMLSVSNMEISVVTKGLERLCRQTQVWYKFDTIGWKIVSAHVSHNTSGMLDSSSAFTNGLAKLLELQIPEISQANVSKNIETTAQVVAPLMDFDLDDTIENAPHFKS